MTEFLLIGNTEFTLPGASKNYGESLLPVSIAAMTFRAFFQPLYFRSATKASPMVANCCFTTSFIGKPDRRVAYTIPVL